MKVQNTKVVNLFRSILHALLFISTSLSAPLQNPHQQPRANPEQWTKNPLYSRVVKSIKAQKKANAEGGIRTPDVRFVR